MVSDHLYFICMVIQRNARPQQHSQSNVFVGCCHLFFVLASVPLPGGCNLEFEMPMSPWLRASYNQNMVTVDHELAALPLNVGGISPCESDALHYEVFHSYLYQRDFTEESFFNAIRLVRTAKGAQEYGREVIWIAIIVLLLFGWLFLFS